MLSKLPNGKEMVCCDCGDDMACAMGKAKMAAACPNRLSCKTVGMHACINGGRHVCVCVCLLVACIVIMILFVCHMDDQSQGLSQVESR